MFVELAAREVTSDIEQLTPKGLKYTRSYSHKVFQVSKALTESINSTILLGTVLVNSYIKCDTQLETVIAILTGYSMCHKKRLQACRLSRYDSPDTLIMVAIVATSIHKNMYTTCRPTNAISCYQVCQVGATVLTVATVSTDHPISRSQGYIVAYRKDWHACSLTLCPLSHLEAILSVSYTT